MLFALMMLGDDRAVRATYVAGQRAHARSRMRGSRAAHGARENARIAHA